MGRWFRVAVNKTENENDIVLHFEHPTLAGTASGGPLQRLKTSGQDITKPVFGKTLTKPGVTRKITIEELKNHDRAQPWFVVNGEVYDGTPFLNEHPGGSDSITLVAGEDASEDFFAIHSAEGKAKLAQVGTTCNGKDLTNGPQFHIGTLVKSGTGNADPDDKTADGEFLERAKWKDVKLTRKVQVNHDTFLYRFELPRPDQPLGLPVGQHVFVRLKRKDTGELVQRAYTPVTPEGAVGFIELLVKLGFRPQSFRQAAR